MMLVLPDFWPFIVDIEYTAFGVAYESLSCGHKRNSFGQDPDADGYVVPNFCWEGCHERYSWAQRQVAKILGRDEEHDDSRQTS